MTTEPGIYTFTVYQGATFNPLITWKDQTNTPVNLTGYTARMMMRTAVNAPLPFVTLTTENGGITLGGMAGTIALLITATTTTSITPTAGFYDLELIDGSGNVTRLLQGNVIISQEVTR